MSKKSSEKREQSDNGLWSAVTKGRLTAANHHDIFTKISLVIKKQQGMIKPKTNPLISKIFSTNDITNREPIKWGKLNAVVALKELLFTVATKDRNFNELVNKYGLFLTIRNLILEHHLMQERLTNIMGFVL